MKVTIASVKAKLSVGTEFTGEFIGVNAQDLSARTAKNPATCDEEQHGTGLDVP